MRELILLKKDNMSKLFNIHGEELFSIEFENKTDLNLQE